jgi:hypothetical protein
VLNHIKYKIDTISRINLDAPDKQISQLYPGLSFHYYSPYTTRTKVLLRFKVALSNYIAKETNDEQFLQIFSGKEVVNKVNWIGAKNSLNYFIIKLKDHKSIKVCDHFITASNCFLINGKTFTNDELKSNNTLPKKTKPLDDAIILLNSSTLK